MDNLAKDSTAALKAGMSYGKWKALHPFTKHQAETAENVRLCHRCGNPIPKSSQPSRKYCSDLCKMAADSARYGKKNQNKAGSSRRVNLTDEQIKEARNEWFTTGVSYRELAERYGVGTTTMQKLIKGVARQGLPDEEE